MLIAPNDPLTLNMPRGGSKDKRFHQIPRNGGEADKFVVTQVLLPAVLEDWSDIFFPQLLRHLPPKL